MIGRYSRPLWADQTARGVAINLVCGYKILVNMGDYKKLTFSALSRSRSLSCSRGMTLLTQLRGYKYLHTFRVKAPAAPVVSSWDWLFGHEAWAGTDSEKQRNNSLFFHFKAKFQLGLFDTWRFTALMHLSKTWSLKVVPVQSKSTHWQISFGVTRSENLAAYMIKGTEGRRPRQRNCLRCPLPGHRTIAIFPIRHAIDRTTDKTGWRTRRDSVTRLRISRMMTMVKPKWIRVMGVSFFSEN